MMLLQVTVETKKCRYFYEFIDLPKSGTSMILTNGEQGSTVFYNGDRAVAKAEELFKAANEAIGKGSSVSIVGPSILIKTLSNVFFTFTLGKAHNSIFKEFVELYEKARKATYRVPGEEEVWEPFDIFEEEDTGAIETLIIVSKGFPGRI
ncbi:MAG: hypothetical protein KO464_02310 [Candidatus Methanofastidiosum sp.]|nr:hypothetical protein [Methanofastidiosum sp.]